MEKTLESTRVSPPVDEKRSSGWQKSARFLPLLVTAVSFAYLYVQLSRAAARDGSSLIPYLARNFETVSWYQWLALMAPYSVFFFIMDSLVTWNVIKWFHVRIRYIDILPIRGSAYILSLVNEQVSKGAIALYLNRRDGIPGWEVSSSMLFIMLCEYFSLILWGTIGSLLRWHEVPKVFHLLPTIAIASGAFLVVFHLVMTGTIWSRLALRDRPIFRSFRLARFWHYGAVLAMRAPLVISGVVVYTLVLRLFGGSVSFAEMLGFVPVVFFGASLPGPMHSVAIVFWVLLFPDKPGQMTAFGFVQHNSFMLFNAAIGLLFLRRATRELFPRT
jgi:hypothetical protein